MSSAVPRKVKSEYTDDFFRLTTAPIDIKPVRTEQRVPIQQIKNQPSAIYHTHLPESGEITKLNVLSPIHTGMISDEYISVNRERSLWGLILLGSLLVLMVVI
jgi:hypothetical protein